ncbi:MAG: IclR family transcriptional regulator [Pseudomonadota bacterium]
MTNRSHSRERVSCDDFEPNQTTVRGVTANHCSVVNSFGSLRRVGDLDQNFSRAAVVSGDYDVSDEPNQAENGRTRGVQSVETGVKLLKALAETGGATSLTELSTRVGMAPAKVHRYLASFVQTGMVEHRRAGRYDLGRLAAEVGMAAISRVDVVNRAADRLPFLVEQTNAAAMLTVWTPRGPTVVRWERAREPMSAVISVGAIVPLHSTATGQVFIAHMPDKVIRPALEREHSHEPADIEGLRRAASEDIVFRTAERFVQGIFSLARPVFGLDGKVAAVVTLLSSRASLITPGGHPEEALRNFD